jgi:hypothetical protein
MLMAGSIVAICGLGSFFFFLAGICTKPAPSPLKGVKGARSVHRTGPELELISAHKTLVDSSILD